MDEQWIQEMRQKMASCRRPAPEVSWEEIDRALAVSKARKARLLWVQRMATAAVVLLIAGVGYWHFTCDDTEPILPTTALVGNQPQDKNYRDKSCDLAGSQYHGPAPMILAKTSQTPSMILSSVPESEAATTIPTVDTVNTTSTNENEQRHTDGKEEVKPKEWTYPVIYPSDLHQRRHLDNRLTAKVYVSSTMAGNLKEFNIGSSSPFWNIKNLEDTAQAKLHVRHHQPMRIGFSLRYRLNDRWNAESGLSYTRLSSDITIMVDDKTTVTEQRLNYIGLPLNISYDLWKSRNFGLYISAGGMIEKSLDTSPWQFSFNGAAGAEYKLTDFFSIYAEPGLGYYFKDGSSTPTIYQDHPLNFNLSFGLRFSLK